MRQDVIVRTPLARANESQIVDNTAYVWKQTGHVDAGLPVFLEPERSAHQRARIALPYAHSSLPRQRLAVIFIEHRLRIEGVDMTDAAAHEKRNDGLGARLEMALPGSQRRVNTGGSQAGLGGLFETGPVGGEQTILRQQASERQAADAFAGFKQKIPARDERLFRSGAKNGGTLGHGCFLCRGG